MVTLDPPWQASSLGAACVEPPNLPEKVDDELGVHVLELPVLGHDVVQSVVQLPAHQILNQWKEEVDNPGFTRETDPKL